MSPDPTKTTGVSFSVDVDEEAIAATNASPTRDASPMSPSLSKSSRVWDIDGDGKLDDTELALKNMDSTNKGTLTKEQMYQLMNTNLKMQRELTKIKKVVFLLVACTVLLALANVGVSFAAAYLAKDTKSSGGALVDAATGRTLKTDATATVFEEDAVARRRHLQICSQKDADTTMCETKSFTHMSIASGSALCNVCQSGGNATVRRKFLSGSVNHVLCAIKAGDTAMYTNDFKGTGMSAMGITKANSQTVIKVRPNKPVDITSTPTSYFINGLLSFAGAYCDIDSDCVFGCVCRTGTCHWIKKD